MPEDAVNQLLRHCVYLSLDDRLINHFRSLAASITDWEQLITQAEANALSSLLYRHLQTCGIQIPGQHHITLRALIARHQRNNRERISALREILDKFAESSIPSVVLKGMSLIHTLYDEGFQRPMGDIDILVKTHQALDAQQQLRELGYAADDQKQGYQYDHHHLPVASKTINGFTIQVEVHHNALSGDAAGSLDFEAVRAGLQKIQIGGSLTHALSHIQMLKHLCHHTFEPSEKIKLGAVADIYGYATKYCDDIDWHAVRRDHFLIINTLRCLHFLSPLPLALETHLQAPVCKTPNGVGFGFPPLSSTLIKSRSGYEKYQRLFHCSDWWRHIFYQIPPEKSLLTTRYIRHPIRIFSWLCRRFMAGCKSKLA